MQLFKVLLFLQPFPYFIIEKAKPVKFQMLDFVIRICVAHERNERAKKKTV